MPTNRQRRGRQQRSKAPDWWLRYLETGEPLQPDHPDYQTFLDCTLLAGWAEKVMGWPPPPD